MIYKVKLIKSLENVILSDIEKYLENRRKRYSEDSLYALKSIDYIENRYELWSFIISILSENPYYYPELNGKVRMIIDNYLTIVPLYEIKGNEVFIFDFKLKEEIIEK